MNEQLKALFENAGLPTDFNEKASVLFTATVNEAVKIQLAEEMKTAQTAFETHLSEAKDSWIAEQGDLVEAFLKNAVVEWAQENASAIDAKLKTEIAESILESLRTAFAAQGVEVPADQVDVVEAAKAAAEAAKAELAIVQESLAASQAELITFHKASVLAEATDGMSEVASEKVAALCENLAFADIEGFKRSVSIIAEAFGGPKCDPAKDGAKPDDAAMSDEDKDKAMKEAADKEAADKAAADAADDKGVDAADADGKGKEGEKVTEGYDVVAEAVKFITGKK